MSDQVSPYATAREMRRALESKQVTASELLDLHLRRIDAHNEKINVIVTRDDAAAREAAERADGMLADEIPLPLLGLPVTIKDAIDAAGLPTTNGLPDNASHVAESDAPNVARLREGGAVIVGKTNVPAGGGDWQADNSLFGRTNNPWNPERTSGGSTGGAAAIATGMSALELGSDIGGSLRIPAAFCGVFSHKPSETALPRGTRPNPALGMAVQGPIARSAADLELALEVMAGPVAGEDVAWRLTIPQARGAILQEMRVAFLPRLPWLPVDDEIVAAQEGLMTDLARRGVTVEETMPEELGDGSAFYHHYLSLLNALSTRNLPEEVRQRSIARLEEAGDPISLAKARGMAATIADYIAWHEDRERYREAYRRFFRDWDVLVSPVTVCPAFPHTRERWLERRLDVNGEPALYDLLSAHPSLATFPGQPATSFPLGVSRDGLPIGLQAIGPYLEDRTTIRFAALIENEFGGFTPPPGFEG